MSSNKKKTYLQTVQTLLSPQQWTFPTPTAKRKKKKKKLVISFRDDLLPLPSSPPKTKTKPQC